VNLIKVNVYFRVFSFLQRSDGKKSIDVIYVLVQTTERAALLYYIWMFVYFFCFHTPSKRHFLRRRNLARSRATTMSRTSVGLCVYMGGR